MNGTLNRAAIRALRSEEDDVKVMTARELLLAGKG
jgi:hypothetical protein|tara:strand:+ start:4190 stop:4294 length:105 start_codon:yes stop_codon:yes gene_type:complete